MGEGVAHGMTNKTATFVNIGERTNVTGSARVQEADPGRRLSSRARSRAPAGRERRADHRRQHGRGPARFAGRHDDLPQADRRRARHRPRADHDRQFEVERDRGRPEVRRGQADRQFDLHEGRRRELHRARQEGACRYGAAVVVMAFDEKGQADTKQRKVEICAARLQHPGQQVGFPPEDIIFDPNIFAVATGIEEHNNYGVDFIEATREIKAALPGRQDLRRRVEPLLLLPRQRAGAPGDALGLPLSRHPGRHGHGHRQCRPARGLRPDPTRAARGRRGRDPQPHAGAEPVPPSAWSSSRPSTRAPARRPRRRTPNGAAGRSRSGWSMRWSRASTSSSSTTPRRRACSSPARSR